MTNIFKRLFSFGSAEAHSALDKIEDPVKMTEQGIREMKSDLHKSLEGLAEVKALVIRSKNEQQKEVEQAKEYESKALQLLTKSEAGQLDSEEAERLATEALKLKEHHAQQGKLAGQTVSKYEGVVKNMESTVNELKATISSWENELKTLKARIKVSTAQKSINKHLSSIDTSATTEMLERMRDKVNKEEALAESYAEMANGNKSVEDEINASLSVEKSVAVQSDLERLKAKAKKA